MSVIGPSWSVPPTERDARNVYQTRGTRLRALCCHHKFTNLDELRAGSARLVVRALPLALLLARGGKLNRPLPAFVAGLPVPGFAIGALALRDDRRRLCSGGRSAN